MVFADTGEIISGGNFHGEYPAKVHILIYIILFSLRNRGLYFDLQYVHLFKTINKFFYICQVLDYLAIGVHELANMSERRIERLVNPGTNNCLSIYLGFEFLFHRFIDRAV